MSVVLPADQEWIDEQLVRGTAILFLGAGATFGAVSDDGKEPVSGDTLRDLLSDEFLNGQLKTAPLQKVAELAKGQRHLLEVQEFIAAQFSTLKPAEFHLLIPKFRWAAIATTNYDLVVERAYERAPDPQQKLVPIIRDSDLSQAMAAVNAIPYFKLHGCVTDINDPSTPLILASEEYAKHKKNREQMFKVLQDLAKRHPIIFCGYDISDANIAQVLWDIGDNSNNRPRYVTVNFGLTAIEQSYWRDRRVIPVVEKFEDFLTAQDSKISAPKRLLASLLPSTGISLKRWIPSHEEPNPTLSEYLKVGIELVHPGIEGNDVTPSQFFSGLTHAWSIFSRNLDVKRRITDDLILEAILSESAESEPRFFLLKGYAGSGKSIALQRAAWEASSQYEKLVFFIPEGGALDTQAIIDIFELVQQNFYVFIHDAIGFSNAIENTIKALQKRNIPVTIIAATRTNEWNTWGDSLDPHVTQSFELTNLSEKEISDLLEKLEKYDCLGELKGMSPESRNKHFRLSAERQLLVALHETTNRKPFQEIIADEYEKIIPAEAKQLYLDICTLHKFGVGVRAGLISRVSGIEFDHFQNRLIRPLEHVVSIYEDSQSRDFMYRSRHQIISSIVFDRAFKSSSEKSAQIIRMLNQMNLAYSSDSKAFKELVKGRSLAETFPEKQLCENIFEAAKSAGATASYLSHQRALLELNHPAGSLKRALDIIKNAELEAVDEKGVDNLAILHTKAAILQKMANQMDRGPEKERYRIDARSILSKQVWSSKSSHAFSTYSALILDELEEKLALIEEKDEDSGSITSIAISKMIQDAEKAIGDGLQRFPSDEYLKSQEARLALLLKNRPRAKKALETAFSQNKGNAIVALRLARFFRGEQKIDQAMAVINDCLSVNPTEKLAHLEYAKLLMAQNETGNKDAIIAHLRKSFSDGDSNFDAQFWYARYMTLFGDSSIGRNLFKKLKAAPMTNAKKNEKRGFVRSLDGKDKRYHGRVKSVSSGFCFLACSDFPLDVFAHHSEFSGSEFEEIAVGKIVDFYIGFTFQGPSAAKVLVH